MDTIVIEHSLNQPRFCLQEPVSIMLLKYIKTFGCYHSHIHTHKQNFLLFLSKRGSLCSLILQFCPATAFYVGFQVGQEFI